MKHIYILLIIYCLLLPGFRLKSAIPENECNTAYTNAPRGFIQNGGQVRDAEVLYYARLADSKVYFTRSKVYYIFFSGAKSSASAQPGTESDSIVISEINQEFPGSNSNCEISALEKTGASMNFYYPGCRDGIKSIAVYNRIIYRDFYKNIDLVYYFSGSGSLKYDFVVRPGGNPSDIKIRFSGCKEIAINNGGLNISNGFARYNELLPFSYQLERDKQISIGCRFVSAGKDISFAIGNYDRRKTLIIDPEIMWSTYLGGSDGDHATSITRDKDNEVIVTGYTLSDNFPTGSGAIQTARAGIYDGFLAKYDITGKLLWSTYFGGEETDYSTGVTCDKAGNIYICGYTWSRFFPVTGGAFQTIHGGGLNDGFIAGFSHDGFRNWATYYGGWEGEHFYAIATNGFDEIAVTGWTESQNFYVTPMTYNHSSGKNEDAFLVRLNLDGTFKWASMYGGETNDAAHGLAYDKDNNIIMAGYTSSQDFPVVKTDPRDKSKPDDYDLFVARFNTSSTFQVDFATLYGGKKRDECNSVAVDSLNNILLTGATFSNDFPVGSAIQNRFGNVEDAIIMKLNPQGKIIWSTYYGGSGEDEGNAIAADKRGCVLVLGRTSSSNFRTTPNTLQTVLKGPFDAFVVKLDTSGQNLYWSTYLGGSGQEWGWGISSNDSLNVLVAGATESDDFPVTPGANQVTRRGGAEAFIMKLCSTEPAPDIEIFGKQAFCPGDSIKLRVTLPFKRYLWSTGDRTREIIVKKAGDYWVEVVDSLGCKGRSGDVSIRLYDPVPPPIIGNPGFCEGDSTTISVAGNYKSILWSTGAKTKDLLVKTPGNYSVTALDSNGCRVSSSIYVTRYANPRPKIRGQTSVCAFSKRVIYRISANADEDYTWELDNGSMVYGVDSISVIIDFGAGGKATLRINANNVITGCLGYDTIQISINDKLQPRITSNKNNKFEFCEGDTIILDAGEGYFSYQWSNGAKSQYLEVSKPGTFSVLVKDPSGCEGSDTVEVKMNPLPNPKITGPLSICEFSESEYRVEPVVSGSSYTWTIEGGVITKGDSTSKIAVKWDSAGPGKIELAEATDATGCTSAAIPLDIQINPLPKPEISVAGDTVFCMGDSVILDAGGPYSSYKWSNGAVLQKITIRESGIYNVTVSDINGCSDSAAKPVTITVYPKPGKPQISQVGDSLVSSPAYSLQWMKDGSLLTGATDSIYIPQSTGNYSVIAQNEFGCADTSSPFSIWKGFARITLALPDTILAKTGDKFIIPINITESKNLLKVGANDYNLYLRINKSVMLPDDINIVNSENNDEKILKINGVLKDTTGLLAEIPFTAALGEKACSDVIIDSVTWGTVPVDVFIINGVFCLSDICPAGGTRLFSMKNSIELTQNFPNPFSAETEIGYSLIEEGQTRIEVSDVLGRSRLLLLDRYSLPGSYSFKFTSGSLPSGVYYLILRTPNQVITRRMEVIK